MKSWQKIGAIAFIVNEVLLLSVIVWMFCFLAPDALLPQWAMMSAWILGALSIPLGALALMGKGGKK
ncbi:MAG: hypothetical protein Q4F99_00500 [bacterium]|nr:hypothetical protein [bacterium]